jgi:hypothetical protein
MVCVTHCNKWDLRGPRNLPRQNVLWTLPSGRTIASEKRERIDAKLLLK